MSLGASAMSVMKGYVAPGIKKVGIPGMMAAGGFMMEANQHVKQGDRLGNAVFKAGVSNALYATNPVLMTAATLAPVAVQGVQAAHQFRRGRAEQIQDQRNNRYRVGGGFTDTQQSVTMRQAAVEQIQGNKLNARSALGGEARLFANKYL